jgi:hypothetical protein
MTTLTEAKQPLIINFKSDSLTAVSRTTLRAMAMALGFNETQTVLFALARLREQVLTGGKAESFEPLTKEQHAAIAKAAPEGKGTVIDSLLR